MVWTKLSDDFPEQCADLTDAAFRTHVEGLIWTMDRESGGQVLAKDVKRLAESEARDAAVTELVAAGFWAKTPGGYRIAHHMEHQPEPEVLVRRREADAARQRRKRFKAVGLSENASADAPDAPAAGARSIGIPAQADPPGDAPSLGARNGTSPDVRRHGVTSAVMTHVTRDGTGRVGTGRSPKVRNYGTIESKHCQHGVENGREHDPWNEGRHVCQECDRSCERCGTALDQAAVIEGSRLCTGCETAQLLGPNRVLGVCP